ncbi:transglycosylase domain-containing protein [Pseudalkalibacillus decolorationis]|uniref:transglycosylase domain-containing protein n=1 Tax=Pseudalkalibacillus decolorationis TaxID=163879 RepID=UPI00214996EA|nr:PBP1A family penicillin-binding protein [Pseudalkalibacillus decolorationis]
MKKRTTRIIIAAIALIFLSLLGYMGIIFAGNYVIDEKDLVMSSATTLVDDKGDVITKLYAQNRELVEIEDIPEHVQQAFIAVEDRRFYDHSGIDYQAIGRALYKDILAGGKVEGGSTITQQLAKNIFLSHDKTWLRKTKEAIIAINLERKYTKKEILEMYLNQIYFGHGAYGIQSASKLFFDKEVGELTLEEGALLAGLPKAPNGYSPIDHPEKSKKRRDLVLSLMADVDFISAEQAVRAQGKTISLHVHRLEKNPAYLTYIDMVLDEAKKRYSLSSMEVLKGGYKIAVPMNPAAQKTSYKAFQNDTYFNGSDKSVSPQGAFVLMDPNKGGVLAVQGGRDYVRQGFNRVTAKRQPGSTFKPLAVYGPALEMKKWEPYSLLKDERLDYGGYTPENYDGNYQGTVSMYEAIVDSINAPAVWLLNKIGMSRSLEYLQKLGMDVNERQLGVALGGLDKGVSPLQIASAFSAFANEGSRVEPYFIQAIYDRDGKLIEETNPKEKKVFSKQTAWYMTKMLRSVMTDGTGKKGDVNTDLAGKTGTTTFEQVDGANKDLWFAGYTPKAVGAVWIGYDRTTKQRYMEGSSSDPTVMFKDILKEIPEQQKLAFQKPKGVKDLEPPIEMVAIDDLSAQFAFSRFGVPGVELTWTASEDERLMYKIYINTEDGPEKVDTVIGEGSYTVVSPKLFTFPEFYVVPYNPLTKKDGEPSNTISTSAFN